MSSKVEYVQVSEHFEGQRLDNFLLRHLKGLPKSRLYRLIRKGEIRVNKKRCDVSDRLHAGDEIRLPPIRLDETELKDIALTKAQNDLMDRSILFENDDFLVFNKPSGLAVHGGSGVSFGLIEMLRKYKPEFKNLELVHRLDRDTSGLILLAKKMSALRILHGFFRDDQIKKIYTALVKGYWPAKLKFSDARLEKQVLQSGERMVKVNPKGQTAATSFRVLKRNEDTSLISCELHTGRTHQIRVHTQHAGFPIAGDDKYGDKEFNKKMAAKGVKRLCLHATEIEFTWPETKEAFHFTAPVPEVFELV